jgi:hypothetical protein
VASSVGFVQNHVFRAEAGYFDREGFSKPLLHLWSLAVEEQFYLVTPVLLAWAWGSRVRMRGVLWGGCGISLALSLASAVGWVQGEFFLLPQRIWELGAGALLAWHEWSRRGQKVGAGVLREAGAWVGLLLVGTGFFLLREKSVYPGAWALVPVIGTLLMIQGGGWLNRRVLGWRGLVWVGRVSYPLYLFHWPALVWVHLVAGETPSGSQIWSAMGVAIGLSILTYWFVERPLRKTESWRVAGSMVGCFLLLGCAGLAVWNRAGIQSASASGTEDGLRLFEKVDQAVKDNKMMVGLQKERDKTLSHATYLRGDGSQTLFYGDSHVEQWAPRIVSVLSQSDMDGRGAIFVTEGGCPPIPGVVHRTNPESEHLLGELERVLPSDDRIDRVVLGARWGLYFSDSASDYLIAGHSLNRELGREAAFRAFSDFLGRLVKKHEVFVLLDSPTGSRLDPRNLRWKRGFWGIRDGGKKKLSTREYLARESWLRERLKRIAAEHGAKVIDPLPYLTEGDNCLAENDDGPIRYDSSHLRPSYVRQHATWMDQTVKPRQGEPF